MISTDLFQRFINKQQMAAPTRQTELDSVNTGERIRISPS